MSRYDSYKQIYQQQHWETTLNDFIGDVGSDVDTLDNAQAGLNNLVNNWTITEDYLILGDDSPSYVSAKVFAVAGNKTTLFTANKIIHAYCGTTTKMVYSTVASNSVSGATTNVSLVDSVLTSGLEYVFVVNTRDGLYPYGPGYIIARDYGTPSQSTLATAQSAIGVLDRTLVATPGTWAFASSMTINSNINSKLEDGAIFSMASGVTLTINGTFDAGPYKVFDCTGTGKVEFGPGAIEYARWEWWGTDAAALQAAFTACPQVRLVDNATYTLDYATIGTIYLNNSGGVWRYKLIGGGNSVINLTGYTDTYAFTMNQDSGGTRISASMTHPRFVMEDVKVDGANSTSAKFLLHNYTGIQFIRCEFRNMKQGAYSASYCDNSLLDNVKWYTPVAGGWLYENTFAGDGFMARQIHTGDYDCIRLVNCQGGAVENCINGHYSFENCGAINYLSNHIELGQTGHIVKVRNSDILISNNSIRNDAGSYKPIYIDDNSAVEKVSNIIIADNSFPRNIGVGSSRVADIYIYALNTGTMIELKNNITKVYKIDVTDNVPYLYQDFGVMIRSNISALDTLLGTMRNLFSKNIEVLYHTGAWRVFAPPGQTKIDIVPLNNPTIAVTENTDVPLISAFATGDYHYRAVLYNDLNSARSVKSADLPITKTSSTSSLRIAITADPWTYLYLYRGTVADTYTAYCRIPLCKGNVILYDTGGAVGNLISTYLWEAGPGAITATTNISFAGEYNVLTGNRLVKSTIATKPSAGTRPWIQGDQWIATNPASGSTATEWCTVAGSPGTWKGNALP